MAVAHGPWGVDLHGLQIVVVRRIIGRCDTKELAVRMCVQGCSRTCAPTARAGARVAPVC
eukprot:366024-Chlamydomonas_euryale.AAC.28